MFSELFDVVVKVCHSVPRVWMLCRVYNRNKGLERFVTLPDMLLADALFENESTQTNNRCLILDSARTPSFYWIDFT